MGLQKVVWGVTVVIFVFCKGCHSQEPACGMANFNETAAGPEDWPWHVSLNLFELVYDYFFSTSCGGSLISNEWILTAAHCVTRSQLNLTVVHLGRRNMSGPNPNEVTRGLIDMVCHPDYNLYTDENDICLLKLSAPVNFTDDIQPICLAAANSTFYNGTSSWVTGYGTTSFYGLPISGPQEMTAMITGNNECQCYHQPFNITRDMICATRVDAESYSCQNDYGGPLMSRYGSIFVQSGVVSWGITCGIRTPSPGVYTRVSNYHQWIDDTVTGMRPGFVTFMSKGNNSDLYFTCPSPSPSNPYPPEPNSTTPSTPYPPEPNSTTPSTPYPPEPNSTTPSTPYPPEPNSTTPSTPYPPYPYFTTPDTPPPHTPCSYLRCAGENLIHFTNFIALSILALVFHAFVSSS